MTHVRIRGLVKSVYLWVRELGAGEGESFINRWVVPGSTAKLVFYFFSYNFQCAYSAYRIKLRKLLNQVNKQTSLCEINLSSNYAESPVSYVGFTNNLLPA